jgi:hypothetical protein
MFQFERPNFLLGCCHGLCESNALDHEVVATDNHMSEGRDRAGQHGLPGGDEHLKLSKISTIREMPEQENSSPKMRLRRIIRDFAHKVVGQGLVIEAQSLALAAEGTADKAVPEITVRDEPSRLPGILRMDKRLSRLEIQTRSMVLNIALQDVHSFKKGSSIGGIPADHSVDPDSVALTVVHEVGPDTLLYFESPGIRDQAFTCFKIFHMSVFQSMDTQTLETQSQDTETTVPRSP